MGKSKKQNITDKEVTLLILANTFLMLYLNLNANNYKSFKPKTELDRDFYSILKDVHKRLLMLKKFVTRNEKNAQKVSVNVFKQHNTDIKKTVFEVGLLSLSFLLEQQELKDRVILFDYKKINKTFLRLEDMMNLPNMDKSCYEDTISILISFTKEIHRFFNLK
jgi:hypothetical protein